LVDLRAAHHDVADDVAAGFDRVLSSGGFVGGPEVAAFEAEYAEATGLAHCVGLASGTDAVEFALRASGVEAGDEVVLPANTFVATAEAAHRIGARPVLADIDPTTYLVDVDGAMSVVTEKTRAIVPVHLYGQLAPIERFQAQLIGTKIRIVEDAAQCQGATRKGRAAGSNGIAATSFYAGKNLGAYGEAGAVVTDDETQARRVRLLSSHGGLKRYEHDIVGYNSRLDALQAVVLRAKLRRLQEWNDARRAVANRYHELLGGLDLILPTVLDGNDHVWHLYVVRLPDDVAADQRDRVVQELNDHGIHAAVHYPRPVHLTKAFEYLGYRSGSFPRAEQASERIFSLPIYPHLTFDQQDRVVAELSRALHK